MRTELVKKFADEFREAETYFLETDDDDLKWKVFEKINKVKLSEKEEEYLYELLQNMGV